MTPRSAVRPLFYASVRSVVIPILACAIVLAGAAPAVCQCGEWLPGDPVPGVKGAVYSMLEWDPDSGGPQGPLLMVGGSFTAAGDTVAKNIAAWDGTSWHSFGGGISGAVNSYPPPAIRAMTVYEGQLIAGGDFTDAGGMPVLNIAAWDGTSWQSLGPGINGSVYALIVHDGRLYAGVKLSFGHDLVLRWTGSSWESLMTGSGASVNCFAVYRGSLIAGGDFFSVGGLQLNCIASWNGTSWQALGSGVSSATGRSMVMSLIVKDDRLIAGGQFRMTEGAPGDRIAVWDGNSWSALGSGFGDAFEASVNALANYQGLLIAGGSFNRAGVETAQGLASWNGTAWQPMGDALNIRALCNYGGRLIAGGVFSDGTTRGIAAWDGTWVTLGRRGISSSVYAITQFRGDTFIGGGFSTTGSPNTSRIARGRNGDWHAMGMGMDDRVRAFAEYRQDLIAAGNFTVPANHIARWNGFAWQVLGSGISGEVYALAVFDGELIAGGFFSEAGGLVVNNIARWDGESWRAMGEGTNGLVSALAVYGGELIAGGDFTTAGGVSTKCIARWNGTSWQPMGGGITGGVYALKLYQGQLAVGGGFTAIGSLAALRVATWDGTAWHALGSGMSGSIRAIAVCGRGLVAGGSASPRVWNGVSWSALGDGTDGVVRAFQMLDDLLLVGGDFTTAGGLPSVYLATWDPDGPVIDLPPAAQVIENASMASFSVTATGTGSLTYEWRKDGVPLLEAGEISGVTSDTLTINSVELTDAGSYQVVVSDTCGPTISESAMLTVTCSSLAMDFNRDCDVDPDDFNVFLNCAGGPNVSYAPGCALEPDTVGMTAADFDRDGDLDADDFGVFQRCFSGVGRPADAHCAE